MSFSLCPTEILCHIFLYLPDSSSILRCRAVCRSFLNTIDSSVQLQYRIKLDIWGYEDNVAISNHEMSTSERLGKLRRHVAAWDMLDYEEIHIPLPDQLEAYAFAPGVFFGVTVIRGGDSGSFLESIYVEFPSYPSNTPYSIQRTKLDVEALAQIQIDPSQDLLVIVEL